jgi:hypothetical protein
MSSFELPDDIVTQYYETYGPHARYISPKDLGKQIIKVGGYNCDTNEGKLKYISISFMVRDIVFETDMKCYNSHCHTRARAGCANCGHVYFCSRACYNATYQLHKLECYNFRNIKEFPERIKSISLQQMINPSSSNTGHITDKKYYFGWLSLDEINEMGPELFNYVNTFRTHEATKYN